MNYAELLNILAPEIVLTAGVFALLGVDLVVLRGKPRGERCAVLGVLCAVFLAAAALLACRFFQFNTRLLGNMLVINPLTTAATVAISLFALITALLSTSYHATEHVGEYYALLLFSTLGMVFMVLSEELVMIYVGLELTSLSLYILAAFEKRYRRSAEAAMKYFLFGALSSAFLYFGLSLIYGTSAATSLAEIGRLASAAQPVGKPGGLLLAGLLFTVVGFGFKIALAPFHFWAPDAYEGAPAPITGFLSTASKAASFLVFLKVLTMGFFPYAGNALSQTFQAGWTSLAALLAVVSMTLGNLVAMQQRNLKRLLAYSSIAHGGTILVGIVVASALGHAAVLYYLLIYGFTNLGAFGVISAASHATGGDDLEDLSGLARRAPFLSVAMVVFVLSLAGIPPLAGFFAKFYIFAAALGKDQEHFGLLWLVIAGVLNSALSLYYYLKILKQMYIVTPQQDQPIRTSVITTVTLTGCMAAVIALGVYPAPLLAALESLIRSLPVL